MKGKIKRYGWLLVGLLCAVIYWVAESLLHVTVFHTGNFSESLFPIEHLHEIWMRTFTGVLFLAMGLGADWMISKLRKVQQEQERLIVELQESASKIKTLHGLLPICTVCKKVRDDAGYWHQVETYIHEHSEANVEYGYCPECAREILEGITE